MEDGDISTAEISTEISAGRLEDPVMKMANYPDVEVTVVKSKNGAECNKSGDSCTKVNGESDKNHSDEPDEYTSDEDILVIDEEWRRDDGRNHKRVRSPSPRANFKGFKKRIIAKSIHFLKIANDVRNAYRIDHEALSGLSRLSRLSRDGGKSAEGECVARGVEEKRQSEVSEVRTGSAQLTEEKVAVSEAGRKSRTVQSAKKTVKKRPSQKLTEYAQYLGLQPAVKFKCVKCSESSFPSLGALNEHQRQCLAQPPSAKPPPNPAPVPPAQTAPASTNFRVTRKVFLCSSCGTYYENCNLFLHMREVHRRYICLYCLGMFSLPEKLSHHLVTKHNCAANHYATADDFLTAHTDSCFLVCCHCEKVFSERDNFSEHTCAAATSKATQKNQKVTSKLKTAAKTSVAHVTADSPSTSVLPAEHFLAEMTCVKTEPGSPATTPASTPAPSQPSEDSQTDAGIHRTSHSPATLHTATKTKEIAGSPTAFQAPTKTKENLRIAAAKARATTRTRSQVAATSLAGGNPAANSPGIFDSRESPTDSSGQENVEIPANLPGCINQDKDVDQDQKQNEEHNQNQEAERSPPAPDVQTVAKSPVGAPGTPEASEIPQEEEAPLENLTGLTEKLNTTSSTTENTNDIIKNNSVANKNTSSATENSSISARISTSSESQLEFGAESTTGENRGLTDEEEDAKSPGGNNSGGETPKTDDEDEKRSESREKTPFPSESENFDDFEDNELEDNPNTESPAENIAANADLDAETTKDVNTESSAATKSNTVLESEEKVELNSEEGAETSRQTPDCQRQSQQTAAQTQILDQTQQTAPETSLCSNWTENSTREEDLVPLEPLSQTEASDDLKSQDEENQHTEAETTEDGGGNTEEVETRKVPKVTLKLPPQGIIYSENESDDSEKLTMEVDENENENENENGDSDVDCDESQESKREELDKPVNGIDDVPSDDDCYQVAGEDIPVVELELEQPLDKFGMESLLRTCLGATISTCVFCNHARKIAVNGKQLGLHAIAEHRFSATVNSITAEELIPKNFVGRIKECLEEVESVFFSLEAKETTEDDGKGESGFKRVYECFQCRYVTSVHKELYLHNRKMHAKTILLCIMCKSNFYSYSELICHLCPGNYVLNSETKFRCCMCDSNDLPSAFRLMVHLRKRHHTCDVCLEGCNNQSKLSNHVWKHKLHHLCYRCGIAYRNKPDITKHLFWKHGTESVLCKKCLQKKWPHVYHFCVPPASFLCEECNLSFSRAVYLKVHKRLHSNEKPHTCSEENCQEAFISKRLLLKHEQKHREPIEPDLPVEAKQPEASPEKDTTLDPKENQQETAQEGPEKAPGSPEKEETKPKNIIDVYDLPALNLSESDSDSEEESPKKEEPPKEEPKDELKPSSANDLPQNLPGRTEVDETNLEEDQKPVPILDGIWDNFKNYQATIEKRDVLTSDFKIKTEVKSEFEEPEEEKPDLSVILADHDYCLNPLAGSADAEGVKTEEGSTGLDHDYCSVSTGENKSGENQIAGEKVEETSAVEHADKNRKKRTNKHTGSSSSDSSSDSESSSCTCGSNCSCSSSSGSSSSSSSSSESDSSSSEGRRRIQARKERRKERAKRKKESETSHAASNTSAVDVVATEDLPLPPVDLPIQESDLDTDETETDEDFYDEHPQRLANKILAEKRNQLALLAAVAPVSNGGILECSRPSTPSLPEDTSLSLNPTLNLSSNLSPNLTPKKKVKSKKRKKKSRSSTPKHENNISGLHNHAPSITTPVVVAAIPPPEAPKGGSGSETDSNIRSSKRRRVPNKFYGYSSEDELDKPTPASKWRKSDAPGFIPNLQLPGQQFVAQQVAGHAPQVSGHTQQQFMPQLVPPLTIKNLPSPAPVVEPLRAPVIHHSLSGAPESDSDPEEVPQRKSTTDSSDSNRNDDSDSDSGQLHISQPTLYPSGGLYHSGAPQVPVGAPQVSGGGQERNENLYCYCQCPYDEVSEMIACDGKDCVIEWFHFECVGIMVPPKGKWFCPDCRKKSTGRSDSLQT